MNHFTLKFWLGLGFAALAWVLFAGPMATTQSPPPRGAEDVILSGFLTCPTPNGEARVCPFRVHYVNLVHGRTYAIRMASTELHASLTLEDMRGHQLSMDSDDWSTMPGCIVFHPPTTGSYRLIATSAPPTNEGFYTITIRELPALLRVEGALATGDAVRDGCFQKTHDIALTEGRRYILDMESSSFTAFLQLLNPEGAIVAFDDEGSMPRPARIVYTAPRTGTYRLVATSATPFCTGGFKVTVCED